MPNPIQGIVGERVYPSYKPLKAGVVIEILKEEGKNNKLLRVRWLDGTTTNIRSHQLASLDELVSDHEHKLRTHKATQRKLIAMEKQGRLF